MADDPKRPEEPRAGETDAVRIERVEAVLRGLKGEYLAWARQDCDKLERAFALARAATEDERVEAMRAVFVIAHEIKGTGGSFGYDLVSRIGDRLCRLIESRKTYDEAELAIVRAHIDALSTVVSQQLDGDGGAAGQALMEKLPG
jgi:chemotaxis protein histidine kinase CheA